MNYEEACKQVGYNREDYNPPELKYKFFGYKDGQVFECKTELESKQYPNRDKVVDPESKKVRDEYFADRRELERKASEMFETYLRDEYSYLSDAVYDKCYSKAYADGHSSGYDEVAMYLSEIVDFVEDIIKLTKSEKS